MSKVSWYKQRLRALLFKARFADKVEEIKPVRYCDILYCLRSCVCLSFFIVVSCFFVVERSCCIQDLEAVLDASEELRKSPKLQKILEVCA